MLRLFFLAFIIAVFWLLFWTMKVYRRGDGKLDGFPYGVRSTEDYVAKYGDRPPF